MCLRTKITKASCWRRTGEVLPRAEKFGDLMTADHKVLNEDRESRNNHRYAVVVQDLATQWIQSGPCKTKSSWSRHTSQKFFFRQFIWVWKILWRSLMEPSNFNTSSVWDKWDCRKSCGVATIGIGWKMVVWFCGMLLLSAKCQGPLGQMGKFLVKDYLENHSKFQ